MQEVKYSKNSSKPSHGMFSCYLLHKQEEYNKDALNWSKMAIDLSHL